ncbi:MAG: hypothetical protein EBV03_03795 [Proteobacteria bacterium]|nr:hypothetical protein [Pseudomonadota bacterium]
MHADANSLRVVLLYSAGHLGSAIVLNSLYHMPQVNIVGVVRAEPAGDLRRSVLKLSRIGWQFAWLMAWQRFMQFVAFYFIAPLLRSEHLMAAWQFAHAKGIASYQTHNVNNEASLRFIGNLQPDVIVSAYFSQILKGDVLKLPRLGCLNVHPGFLPDYKGAMNYFWVIRNEEDRAGVSVHWMDEGIDTGAVLARKSFVLKPGATQQQVLAATAVAGARLLQRVLRQLVDGEQPQPLPLRAQGAYYPMPGAEDFKEYFKRRRYFRIRDTLKLATKQVKKHVG